MQPVANATARSVTQIMVTTVPSRGDLTTVITKQAMMADTPNVMLTMSSHGNESAVTTPRLLKEDKLNYQYQPRHKPGVHNSRIDDLSRLPLETKTVTISVQEEAIIPLSVVNNTPVNAQDVGNMFAALKIRTNEFAAHITRKNELAVERGCLPWEPCVIPAPG